MENGRQEVSPLSSTVQKRRQSVQSELELLYHGTTDSIASRAQGWGLGVKLGSIMM